MQKKLEYKDIIPIYSDAFESKYIQSNLKFLISDIEG